MIPMKLWRLLLGFTLLYSPALAGELPEFLANNEFATSPNACVPYEGLESDIVINKSGIFGYEFSCTFHQFYAETDPDADEPYAYLVTAICSDDSGIYRGDMITLVPRDEGRTLVVQSQNEFLTSEALLLSRSEQSQEEDFEAYNYVSREYRICK
jgi:hypothetical protein